jgi:hypothetical protein
VTEVVVCGGRDGAGCTAAVLAIRDWRPPQSIDVGLRQRQQRDSGQILAP